MKSSSHKGKVWHYWLYKNITTHVVIQPGRKFTIYKTIKWCITTMYIWILIQFNMKNIKLEKWTKETIKQYEKRK